GGAGRDQHQHRHLQGIHQAGRDRVGRNHRQGRVHDWLPSEAPEPPRRELGWLEAPPRPERQSPFSLIRAALIVAWARTGPAMTTNSSVSQVCAVTMVAPDCTRTASPTASGATSAAGVTKRIFWYTSSITSTPT